jgi:hypothetical protein
MQSVTSIRRFGATLRAFGLATVLAASSAGAAIVWDLNPQNQDGVVLGTSQNFTEQGFTITARGYDDSDRNGVGTATNLYFKNRPPDGGANESGLGLANSPHHEVNGSDSGTLNFIQLDLRSIISQGATNFQIAVTSLQQGESFQLFGSNFEGVLGTAISGPYTGLAFDDKFVAVTDLGSFTFLSVAGFGNGSNVLPSRFSADITPIPEVGTVMPIVGLLVAIGATHVLRRRRAAALDA